MINFDKLYARKLQIFKKERNWISQVEIAKYLMVNVIRDNHKLSICSTQLPKKKSLYKSFYFCSF